MTFKEIDKSFYEEIAPLDFALASSHSENRPDIFPEINLMNKKSFKERIKIKGFLGIAAYKDDDLCGYCFCRIKDFISSENSENKILWIDSFYIKEEFRRTGVGTEFFDEIKRIAKNKGCSLIELEVWEFNEGARNFYDSLGFENQRITKEYKL